MGEKRSFAKNYLFNLVYQIMAIALPLITTPYLSRVLGADSIGKYSFAQSIVSYFALFAALGTTMYGQRLIAGASNDPKERTRLFWEVFAFRTVGVLAACAIYCLFIMPSASDGLLYAVAAIEIVTVAFDITWFYQGMEDFQPIAVCTVIGKFLAIICIFAFVKTREDLVMYVLFYCVSIFLGNIISWLKLPKYLVGLGKGERRFRLYVHFLPALSLFVSQVAVQVYTVVDKTMIGLITKSDFENGYYEQSQKLCRVLVALVCSMGVVMASRVAVLWRDKKKEDIYKLISGSFRFVFALSVPMAIGVILVASRFVPVFYGAGFAPVVPLLSVLVLMLPILGCSNVMGIQLFVPTGREKLLTLSVAMGAVVNFALNLVLIRFYASMGAVIASLTAEAVVTGVQFFFARKEISVFSVLRSFLRYLLFGGIMGAVGIGMSFIAPSGILGMAVIAIPCVAVYGGLLLITKDPVFEFFKGRNG